MDSLGERDLELLRVLCLDACTLLVQAALERGLLVFHLHMGTEGRA